MASKRKSQPVVLQSPAKRLANPSQVGDISSGEEEEEAVWERRPGMILEVMMRNFMCHEKFTFQPNQSVTFLSGENGSGKSAVLTAIVFALGGNARTASRGSSNKEFIRSGQTSALVEIRLLNTGEGAYKPELYGDSILVSRSVTQSSSVYKLKDSQGKVVVDKKVKDELERILVVFNIQVDNPLAVLNQDTAKTFLFQCVPEKLYQFFMRATQLQNCKEDYNLAAQDKSEAETLIGEKKKSLPTLKKELSKWQKKYELHASLNNKKEEVKRKKGELGWAYVRDAEADIEETEKAVERNQEKIQLAEEEVRKLADNEKARLKEKKKLEAEIQDLVKDSRVEDEQQRQLQEDANRKGEKRREAKREMMMLEVRNNTLGKEKKDLKTEIEKLRKSGTEEFEERHRQRLELIQANEVKCKELENTLGTTENHLVHINHNIREVDNKVHELRAEKEREIGVSRKIRANLENLQRSGNNKLAAFGDWMPGVIEDINRSRRFKTKPIGPLGLFIKVKEGTPENIMKTLDNELKNLVHAFLVTCSADQRELFRIFQARRVFNKPSVFTSNFTNIRHNIEAGRVYTDQFHVLIDFLEIDDVNVFNRIVDSAQLERILYISNEADARAVLSQEDQVPRNTNYACVANSYLYYPAPSYRSYPSEERSTGLLKPNMEEYMMSLRQEIQVQANKEKDLDRAINEVQVDKMNHMRGAAVNEKSLRSLQAQIRQINAEIINIKNQDEAESPPDISALEEDLERARRNLEVNTTELAAAKQKFDGLFEEYKVAQQKFQDFTQQLISKAERGEPLRAALSDIEAKLLSDRRRKNHFEDRKKSYIQQKKDGERIIAEKREKLLAVEEKAMGWAQDRIITRKKVDSLKKEICHLEESLRQQEENQESRQLVTQKYQEFRASYTKVDAQIKYMSSTVEFLGQMLAQRRDGYKEIRASTCKNINRNFTTLLSARNYIGQLTFDHRDCSLQIQVNPNSRQDGAGLDITRSVKGLSGGEKSYSSVSLVLALWNAMTPPFRILDEFDVFMDSVNRKIAIDNILNYAKEDRKFQFVFLTPLGTTNIDTGEDVKIVKLFKAQD